MTATDQRRVNLRNVAVPIEHGGWGFLLEPILLGLLVTPTLPGLSLAIGVAGGFLARHPLKIVWRDRRHGRRYPRTAVAERVALSYLAIALAGIAAGIWLGGFASLWSLLPALPFAAIYAVYDVRDQTRTWLAELAGPIALGATAPSITLAGGWTIPRALTLWAILAARGVPAVLYVRARLRLEREENPDLRPALLSHLLGIGIVAGLVVVGLAPASAVVALAILVLRAVIGLSNYRRPAIARQIGFLELFYGAVYVLAVGLGYIF